MPRRPAKKERRFDTTNAPARFIHRLLSTLMPASRFILIWSAALLGGLLLATALPASVQAQEQADTTEASQLPTIAPREIEIRGTLEISLPSIQRQPLTGFNPPPRVPEPSSDRTPYLGSYNQEQVDLPQTLPEPLQIQSTLERPAPPLNGELAAGGGRYFTRHAKAQLWAPLSEHDSFTLDATYEGSNGHEPFETQPSIDTPHDTFDGLIGFQSQRDAFTLNAGLKGFLDTYTLYGTVPDPDAPDASLIAQPDREGRSGAAQINLSTYTRIPMTLGAGYERTRYETIIAENAPEDAIAWKEGRFSLHGEVSLPLIYPTTVDGKLATFSIRTENEDIYDAWHVDGGFQTTGRETASVSIDVGARVLAYSLSPSEDLTVFPDSAFDRSATYLTPSFELEWQSPANLSLYAHNTPGVDANSLSSLFQDNPYLTFSPVVAPTIRTTALEAGLRHATGVFQMKAYSGYTYAPNYQYVQPITTRNYESGLLLNYEAGLFDVRYGSARIIRIGAEASLRRINGFEALVGVEYRNGRLNGPDAAIPFFAPVTARGLLSYAFADQRGQLQLIGHFESPRYLDATETTQVDSYFDLDFRASYDLTDILGLTVRVENMSTNTLERWPRYEQPPLVLTAGMRVRW